MIVHNIILCRPFLFVFFFPRPIGSAAVIFGGHARSVSVARPYTDRSATPHSQHAQSVHHVHYSVRYFYYYFTIDAGAIKNKTYFLIVRFDKKKLTAKNWSWIDNNIFTNGLKTFQTELPLYN